ncbi:hypothetical protein LTR08_004808 [Meristemomyces frigidus]|nr:hypothetical protein LTR08_004808 [Meristemomyces frigidus]
MAYSYNVPPGAYGARPPGGAAPMGLPPGFAPPPGFDAPSPAGIPGQFQPPPNMPANFNFSAPVIRLGVDGQPQADAPDRGGRDRRDQRGANDMPLGGRGRAGLGSDSRGGDRNVERERERVRESMMALQPPTREEVARTIFVGGIVESAPSDDEIESILRCAGKLRRWTRATDADGQKCRFGFAEYEDVESLEAAFEIYREVEVPLVQAGAAQTDGEGQPKMAKLLVVVDEQSQEYIREWKGKRREDDDARQFRIDGCKEDLRQCITALANASAFSLNHHHPANGTTDRDGDTAMHDPTNGLAPAAAEVLITLPTLALEDELSDIPTEQRATVAAEIRAFRDRSTRRDLERLRREEEGEQAERNRSAIAARVSRLASPPPATTPSGPSGGANGLRGSTVAGAPAGPKGYRGAQMPNDYANGVTFVNGHHPHDAAADDDAAADESDDEALERRRQGLRDEELLRQYQDAERRWLNRERTRAAALARERAREAAELAESEREKVGILRRLAEWSDGEEARVAREEYYYDRSSWLRKRAIYREREAKEDARDLAGEARESGRGGVGGGSADARGQADAFLEAMGGEVGAVASGGVKLEPPRQQTQPGNVAGAFKISLGSAAARTKAAAAAGPAPPGRRAMADVEGLLEDEEDAQATGNAGAGRKLALKPLPDAAAVASSGGSGGGSGVSGVSEEEKARVRRQIAAEIPTTTSPALFGFEVQWRFVTEVVLEREVRPFVEKKVLEAVGVVEEVVVEVLMRGLRERRGGGGSGGGVGEGVVRRVWRLVAFWGEAGARGVA